jgi:hypothetical protein
VEDSGGQWDLRLMQKDRSPLELLAVPLKGQILVGEVRIEGVA